MMMRETIDEFLQYLDLECGLSRNTRDAYRRDLLKFASHIGVRSSLADIRKEDLVTFLASRLKGGASPSSVARNCAALRMFFRYHASSGALRGDLADTLEPPRLWKRIPGYLSEREMARLLDATAGRRTRHADRDAAILELLYASGARVSEVAGLREQDVNLDIGYLRCFGKGSKERIVPVGGQAIAKIRRYRDGERARMVRGKACEFLFVSAKRGRLTRETLWRIVRKAAADSGIESRVYPHIFRHSFASHLVEHGADIRHVQEMLGHANVATTQIYTHVDRARLLTLHRKYHPRA